MPDPYQINTYLQPCYLEYTIILFGIENAQTVPPGES
jgi:hypothetical protein